MKATQLMPGTSTTALEILTGTMPLDLALSEVLCQETARLQSHKMDFPLLDLVTKLCQNHTFMATGASPLHTILRTIKDLDLVEHLTSIECQPNASAPQYLDLKRPYVHRGPDIQPLVPRVTLMTSEGNLSLPIWWRKSKKVKNSSRYFESNINWGTKFAELSSQLVKSD